jgi:hypothetical protein
MSRWGLGNTMITDKYFACLGEVIGTLDLNVLILDFSNWGHQLLEISDSGIEILFRNIPKSIEILDINMNK